MGSRGPAPAPARPCEGPACQNEVTGRRRRRFCSRACAARHAGGVRTETVRAATVDRACEYPECGRALVRREGERLGAYRIRRYCAPRCANRHRQQRAQEPVRRTCAAESCAEVLVRRERESFGNFLRRRYCSRLCANGSRPRQAAEVSEDQALVRGLASRVVRRPEPASRPRYIFPEGERTEVWRPGSWGGSRPLAG